MAVVIWLPGLGDLTQADAGLSNSLVQSTRMACQSLRIGLQPMAAAIWTILRGFGRRLAHVLLSPKTTQGEWSAAYVCRRLKKWPLTAA